MLSCKEIYHIKKALIELNARLRPLDNFNIPKLRWEVITIFFALFGIRLGFQRSITAEGYWVDVLFYTYDEFDEAYGFETDEVWVPSPLMVEVITSAEPSWDVLGFQKPFKSICSKAQRDTALDEAISFVFEKHDLEIDPELQI